MILDIPEDNIFDIRVYNYNMFDDIEQIESIPDEHMIVLVHYVDVKSKITDYRLNRKGLEIVVEIDFEPLEKLPEWFDQHDFDDWFKYQEFTIENL